MNRLRLTLTAVLLASAGAAKSGLPPQPLSGSAPPALPSGPYSRRPAVFLPLVQ